MRKVYDMVRGSLLYTDINLLKRDIELIIASGAEKGFQPLRLKNSLNKPVSNVLMNFLLEGISTEIQFIYYVDPDEVPKKNTTALYLEKLNHWAYEISRVEFYPLREPVVHIVESMESFCQDPSKMTTGMHIIETMI